MKRLTRVAAWLCAICWLVTLVAGEARAAQTFGSACSAVLQPAPVATAPGASAIPVSVLLTSSEAVRGVQFELATPLDLTLLDCSTLNTDFTCTMRQTETGVVFVFASFSGSPIPAGDDQPILELIFDVVPLVLDREVVLPLSHLEVLSAGCDPCSAEALPGSVQIVAGCEFFFDDMESGAAGWTHSVRSTGDKVADPVGPDTWRLDQQTCLGNALPSTMYVSNGNRGPACLADSSRDLSQLLSPPIGLPPSGALSIELDALSYDEAGECRSGGRFDRHDVGVTLDGGATYTLLNDCTALADGNGTLLHHEWDLTDFAGQTVQIVLVYDTGDELNGHSFAVDNMKITARDLICGSCDGLTLFDRPPAETPLRYEACGAIIAGGAFHVGESREVSMQSGSRVVLTDGFRVESGGRFSAGVDPGLIDSAKSLRPIPVGVFQAGDRPTSRSQENKSNRRVRDD